MALTPYRLEPSAEGIRKYRYLKMITFFYFVIFMISEYFLSVEIYTNKGFFPEIIFYTIKNSSFPINAYVFWLITPVIMIFTFVLMLGILLDPKAFERFLIGRKNNKNLFWACLFVPIAYVGTLYNQNPSGIMNSICQPLKYKIVFFLLYGGGAMVVSITLAVLVVDLRARLVKNS